MPRDVVERAEFTEPVSVPVTDEPLTAASIAGAETPDELPGSRTGVQALANRTTFLRDQIGALDTRVVALETRPVPDPLNVVRLIASTSVTTPKVTGLATATGPTEAISKQQFDDAIGAIPPSLPDAPLDGATYGRYNATWMKTLPLSGGVMSGQITLPGDPTTGLHATTRDYVQALLAAYLPLAGGTLTGPLLFATSETPWTISTVTDLLFEKNGVTVLDLWSTPEGVKGVQVDSDLYVVGLTHLGRDPVDPMEAATRQYVDAQIAAIPPSTGNGGGIPEAPLDGKQYGRQSAAWTEIVAGAGGGGTGGGGAGRYYRNTAQSVPNNANTIIWLDTIDFLTGDVYTGGQSELFVGTDGLYLVMMDVQWQSHCSAFTIHLHLNNSGTAARSWRFGGISAPPAAWLMQLTAGQSVQMRLQNTSGTDNSIVTGRVTGITIFYVGATEIVAGGGGIPEAPADGSAYGRLDATWAQVLPLTGGTVTNLWASDSFATGTASSITRIFLEPVTPELNCTALTVNAYIVEAATRPLLGRAGLTWYQDDPSVPSFAIEFDRPSQGIWFSSMTSGQTYPMPMVMMSPTDCQVYTPLSLAGDPTNPLHAATKQYVDAYAGGGGSVSGLVVDQVLFGKADGTIAQSATFRYTDATRTLVLGTLSTPGRLDFDDTGLNYLLGSGPMSQGFSLYANGTQIAQAYGWTGTRQFDLYGNLTVTGPSIIMNYNRIQRIATPTDQADAAPKSYVDTVVSDASVKQDVTIYPRGLAEIAQLAPVSYRYTKPFDDGHIHFGLIAAQAQQVIPEMVRLETRYIQPEGTVESKPMDVLVYDEKPVLYALVNAVKELSARVQTLEIRQ